MENNERNEYMAYMRDNRMQNSHNFDEEKAQRRAENRKKYKGLKRIKNMIFALDVFFIITVFGQIILGMQQVAFGSIIIGKNIVEMAVLSLITFTKLTDEDIFKKVIVVSVILWVLYKFVLPFNGSVMTTPYFLYILQSVLCIWLGKKESQLSGEEGYPYFQDIGLNNFEGRTKSYIPTHFANEIKGRKMETVGFAETKDKLSDEKNSSYSVQMGGIDTEYIGTDMSDLNAADSEQRACGSVKMDGVSVNENNIVLSKAKSGGVSGAFMDEAGL